MATTNNVTEEHLTPEEVPVYILDCKESFSKLTDKEKKYAHHFSQACWAGTKVLLEQLSKESPDLFDLFQKLFRAKSVSDLKTQATKDGVSEKDFAAFLQYVAYFYGNLGNYKSFGDQKFIPRLPKDQFTKIINSSGVADAIKLYSKVENKIYSLEKNERELGLPDANGVTTYYSENITKPEIELVQDFMNSKHISPYNTRLWKLDDGTLELRLASVEKGELGTYTHNGRKIVIVKGDYSHYMKQIVSELEKALPYAANDHQSNMIKAYIKHFNGGNIDDHKESQKHWVQDKGPVVETNIGFIESYRDPFGVRGEWEGFVSIVNKETSKKFGALVDNAEKFIALLPWSKDYEKDKFLRPDFTSLEVICFATCGIPAGINIPNYDDLRQTFGFKNVSLGNVLSAAKNTEHVTFLQDSDQDLYRNLMTKAFEVQVGIHELLGHGSGKTFVQDKDGTFNFDKNVVDPFTNKPITSWYKPGETFDSQFLTLASPMEECRAEAVGIYLCLNRDLLNVFGYTKKEEQDDIIYINWLNMVRAGLLGLEFYSPDTDNWRQAHMRGRYSILSTLLKAGGGLVNIDTSKGLDNTVITLDRSKIETVGKAAIAEFLKQMNVYKATANVAAANQLFNERGSVSSDFKKLRDVVIAKKKPRKVFVQVNTKLVGDKIELVEYEATAEGMIKSYTDRFVDNY